MSILLPFQEKNVDRIERLGRALLADEMGLGKTLQGLFAARELASKLTIVICPAMVKWHWAAEAKRHLKMRAEVLETRTPPSFSRKLLNPHQLLIINYDILQYWLEYLIRLKPDLILFDEAHYAKNPRSKRTKATRLLARKAKYVIGLTGTPMWNKIIDLWSILNIIRPDLYPSYVKFAFKYTHPKRVFGHWEFKGAKNLPHLRRNLKRELMIRNLKKDVLDQLPPKIHSIIPLDIDNRKDYKLAQSDFVAWLKKHFGKGKERRKMFRALSAVQMTQLGYLKRLAAKGKMKMLISWIESFLEESNEKLILFGVHKFMVRGLHKIFPQQSVVIDGNTSSKERQIAIDIFQQKKKVRLIIGNMTAMGVGCDGLQKASANPTICELPWVPAEMSQVIDRAHRIGQTRTVFARTFVAKGTIEEKLCAMLQSKQTYAREALDGDNGESLNLMDQLSLALLKEDS